MHVTVINCVGLATTLFLYGIIWTLSRPQRPAPSPFGSPLENRELMIRLYKDASLYHIKCCYIC